MRLNSGYRTNNAEPCFYWTNDAFIWLTMLYSVLFGPMMLFMESGMLNTVYGTIKGNPVYWTNDAEHCLWDQ